MSSAKHWCFTLNNYSSDDLDRFRDHVSSGRADYICIGRETGVNGTPHLQGHLYRKAKARLKWLKRHISDRAHWEVSKSYSDSIDYCKKGSQSKTEWNDLGVSGPGYGVDSDVIEHGDPPPALGERTDLQVATGLILDGFPMRDIALQCPTVYVKYTRGLHALQSILSESYEAPSCRGIWIFGKPGTGKSHATRYHEPDLYFKPQSKWWDGYAGQHAVLIDDFDKGGRCLGHYLKIWADRWKCTGEFKGGTIPLQYRRFYITSNYHPDQIWCEEGDEVLLEAITRRFVIREKTCRSEDLNLLDIATSILGVEDNDASL